MLILKRYVVFTLALLLTACVTINVYFPAAVAEKAANEVLDNVLGDDKPSPPKPVEKTTTSTDFPAPEQEPENDIWDIEEKSQTDEGLIPHSDDSNESNIPTPTSSWEGRLKYCFDFLIQPAHAAPNWNISTPAIRKIQVRMKERYEKKLKRGYNKGAIGFTNNALIDWHDQSKVSQKHLPIIDNWIAEENQDRLALYKEIAVANRHPEWKDKVRAIFAKAWIERAIEWGWWYQDENGRWQK
jgi:hypothetical protein